MELLLSASVAVETLLQTLAVPRVSPLVIHLNARTGRGAVLVALRRKTQRRSQNISAYLGTAALVFVVVEERTGVALATELGGLGTRLRLVVGQHKAGVLPAGVVREVPLLPLQGPEQTYAQQ